MDWDKAAEWSCLPFMFEAEVGRSSICASAKHSFETDGGRRTGAKEKPFIYDILKLELFDPITHELKAMKEWAPERPCEHIA